MTQRTILISALVAFTIASAISGQDIDPSNRYRDAYKQYLQSTCPLQQDSIKHFVYFSADRELIHDHPFLEITRFSGAQIMYSWKRLEPERGKYDFSIIREDYNYLLSHGKKLFIQLQDVTFDTMYRAVPDYLLTEEFDGGCVKSYNDDSVADGWVAKRWNVQVRERFAMLLQALGKEFDGNIEGINLQESAVGVREDTDTSFTPQRYFECLKLNMLALKKAFPKSTTMQYANFMPGEWLPWEDKGYLRSIYKYGQEIGVGLGAPDLMVQRKSQLNHTIAMMHEGHFTVPLGIAIQDGNYSGTTGADSDYNDRMEKDKSGHKNIVPLMHAFAKDFIHVKYMFWVCQEPFFSDDVIPCLME
ncbi:MAG TPA: hypothetical protein VK179_09335 [Bacteroidales bacterium]|nr:hypothetical protein [Bacteroidales bacterium]